MFCIGRNVLTYWMKSFKYISLKIFIQILQTFVSNGQIDL